jgi:hypothetical protein
MAASSEGLLADLGTATPGATAPVAYQLAALDNFFF